MRFLLLIAALLVAMPIASAQNAAERHSQTPAAASKPAESVPSVSPYRGGGDILFDQLQLVTSPGGGFGGADASELQTALGLDTYGAGVQITGSNSIADQFEVPAGTSWTVTGFVFFNYQTGASANSSPFTDYVVQIWDGSPDDPASSVIAGDLSTNVLANSEFSGIYRSIDTDPTANNRPIFANTVAITPTLLTSGTYWVQWSAAGTLSSGPWQPPVTIPGEITTGDALQNLGGTTWQPFVDGVTMTPQGAPFQVLGTEGAIQGPLLTVSPASLEFGSVEPGESVTAPVTLSNVGDEDIVITSIVLTGQDAFSIDQSGTDLTLSSGETTTFDITFAPMEAGAFVATVEITSNNPDGQIDVPVSGSSNVESTYTGTTDGGPLFNRPNDVGNGTSGSCTLSGTGTAVNYDAESFVVSASGDYDVLATWDGFDGYLLIYREAFDPDDPCLNLIGLNDDFNGTALSFIGDLTLSETDTYVAVATSFGNGSAGGYTLTFTGPGTVSFAVSAEEAEALASALAVTPNPARQSAVVTLDVATTEAVSVSVFDATGRRVAVLHDGVVPAGQTLRLALDAASLPSGVYVVRALHGTDVTSRRVTIVR